MRFAIDKESAQALLSYLVTRPYAEVFRLIPLLQAPNLQPLEENSNGSDDGEKKHEHGEEET